MQIFPLFKYKKKLRQTLLQIMDKTKCTARIAGPQNKRAPLPLLVVARDELSIFFCPNKTK